VAAVALGCLQPRALVRSLRALTAPQRRALLSAGVLLAVHFALFLSGLATTSLPAAVALVLVATAGALAVAS
jgi:hypothetical protein